MSDADPTGPPNPRGRFITFEGGEGAGKTTQIQHLSAALQAAGIPVTVTREPGGTPFAEAIRSHLLAGEARGLGPEGEALMFAAARADHVARLIRPALTAGRWVLSDRFSDSTRAYQGAAGVSEAFLAELERVAVGPSRPDLTFILDLPVPVGLARAAARRLAADRFEIDSVAEHERRRAIFLDLAFAEPGRFVVVDATLPQEEVAAIVRRTVGERLGPAVLRG